MIGIDADDRTRQGSPKDKPRNSEVNPALRDIWDFTEEYWAFHDHRSKESGEEKKDTWL